MCTRIIHVPAYTHSSISCIYVYPLIARLTHSVTHYNHVLTIFSVGKGDSKTFRGRFKKKKTKQAPSSNGPVDNQQPPVVRCYV